MQDKLDILLKQINFPEDEIVNFADGKLEKIVCNKAQNKYVFCLTLKQALPLPVYLDFQKLLKNSFRTVKHVTSKIKAEKFDLALLKTYYRHYLEEYSKAAPLLATFIEIPLKLTDDSLIIEVANKAEEMKISSISEELEQKLNDAGLAVKIKITIDEAKALAIQKEIEMEKTSEVPKVAPKENPIIMGREIKNKISDISALTFEMDDVSVEAKVFGIDTFESPKSDFKIITLKLYDGTDSMYCKIFCRDADDFKKYKKIQENKWYKIRGYTKNDKYSGEIVLNARDINISKKQEEQRQDLAPEKRVELHAHTKMSQMDGLVDAKTLVETAYKWGHRAIAITDHNGVQAFPDVYHAICDINKKKDGEPFKALYGTELTLIDDSVDIVIRPTVDGLLETTYVVFDFETTGFNAGGADSIIENYGSNKYY